MKELELTERIQEVKELAENLSQQLQQYQECIRDPEATISIPDMDHICQLAGSLSRKLNNIL